MSEGLQWKAAIWAGLIAGAVFMMVEMILVATIGGQSPWGPPRMIAAIVLGESVLPPPATFDLGIMAAAMMVHFPLSIVFAAILGWTISHWQLNLPASMIVGTVFGVAVYLVDFYVLTAIFPWFAMARNEITLISHAVYGLVLGWSYYAIEGKHGGARGWQWRTAA